MSEIDQTIARVQQLHKMTGMLHTELGTVLHDLEEIKRGRSVSSTSTTAEEMALMEQQLEAVRKASEPQATPEGLKPFIGRESEFAKYLSPVAMMGGKGFMKATDDFKQYEECLLHSPVDSIINWPSGFYRNAETKESQLLLRGDEVAFIYDGLPSSTGKVYVVEFLEEEPQLKLVTTYSDQQLKAFEAALTNCLEAICEAQGF